MRLTLRTLLAYLDDILDPTDKEELSKKVESSEFAEELIHRTRDTTRRLRLSAPQVVGTGMGLDPNTVAEYLDNVLPPDSVGDFERICLESDMHLAEVASCHHILTMVLGEPAEVDQQSRERMYALPTEAASQRRFRLEPAGTGAAAGDGVTTANPTPLPSAVTQTMTLEVPDYLRASGWSATRKALVAIAAVVLIFTAAVLFVPSVRERITGARPTDVASKNAPMSDRSDTPTQPQATAAQNAAVTPVESSPIAVANPIDRTAVTAPSSPTSDVATQSPTLSTATPVSASTGVASSDASNPITAPSTPPASWPATPATTPAVQMPAVEDTGGFGAAVTSEPTGFPPAAGDGDAGFRPVENQIPPVTGTGAIPSWPATAGNVNVRTLGNPGQPPSADTVTQPSVTSPEPRIASVAPDANATTAAPSTATPAEVEAAPIIGAYLGGKTVLLRFNPTMKVWFRMEPRASVMLGDRLQSLPEFRPQISFPTGLQMDISGGTQVVVRTATAAAGEGLPVADDKTPAIELVYGRVVFYNTTNEDRHVRLTVGVHTADVKMSPNAPFGVEVTRSYVPGADPRKVAAPIVANFIAPMPGITWIDRSGERAITEASQWQLANSQLSQPGLLAKPTPEWLVLEPAGRPSEMLAVPTLEAAITPLQPAEVQLLELYEGAQRRELQALTARASVHIGMFDPFIESLRDSRQRANWRTQIDTLRMAMALSPESAERVWLTLVQQRGDRAATDLYEMLCGYSMTQVGATRLERQNGPLARLIAWLENDSLDYRVLAVENLFDITGKRLLQNPIDVTPGRPNAGIRTWKERLAKDDLMPTTPTAGGKQ